MLIDTDTSQTEIADRLQITKQAFNQFLNKQDYRINADIMRIADILGYDTQIAFVNRKTGQKIDAQ
jgi:transcriptional regulator with XRE-family HTH domain